MEEDLPKTIHDVPTPSFLVDIDILKSNCQRMTDRCKAMGLQLRPHMKTHKTVEGAEIMTNGTKRQIVVSTLAEAEMYADNGFDNILYASPMVKEKLCKRTIHLATTLEEFHVFVDSDQGLDALIATPLPDGKPWSVFLELDCGLKRTGSLWNSDTTLQLAKKASESDNINFQGLYVHCGNSYSPDPDVRAKVKADTTNRLVDVKNRLTESGIEVRNYGCGSTPACSDPTEAMGVLTEFHPGNYIFYDYMQTLVGSCARSDIAGRVVTTVISHKPEDNTLTTDGGFDSLSWDGFQGRFKEETLGRVYPIQGHDDLYLDGMTQVLGKVRPTRGALAYSKYPLGSRLYFYPWHSCATAALHPVYYIHSGETIVGVWKPCRGW